MGKKCKSIDWVFEVVVEVSSLNEMGDNKLESVEGEHRRVSL